MLAVSDGESPFPFDISRLLKQFTDNVSISRDDEGVIVTFKNLAPGTDLGAIRQVMENAMRSKGNEMMRRFMSAFTGEDEDDEIDDDNELDDEVEEDEDMDEDGDEDEPGFRIEDLDGGNGFKLVPDDPDDIDGLLDSMSQMFDPDVFENMMRAVSKLFGMQPRVDEEPEGEENRTKKRKQDESNTTSGYFYI